MDEKRAIDAHAEGAHAPPPRWNAISPMATPASFPPAPHRDYPIDEKSHAPSVPSSSRWPQQPFYPSAQQCPLAQPSPAPYMLQASFLPSPSPSPSLSPSPSPYLTPYPFTPNTPYSQTRVSRRIVFIQWLKPWIPVLLYALTSLGFVFAITMYQSEVFQGAFSYLRPKCMLTRPRPAGLDDLAMWLRSEGYTGYAMLFTLIFITTIRTSSSPVL